MKILFAIAKIMGLLKEELLERTLTQYTYHDPNNSLLLT